MITKKDPGLKAAVCLILLATQQDAVSAARQSGGTIHVLEVELRGDVSLGIAVDGDGMFHLSGWGGGPNRLKKDQVIQRLGELVEKGIFISPAAVAADSERFQREVREQLAAA